MKLNMRAFSILELMIVLTILALLAIVSIPSYLKFLRKAAIAETISTLGQYKTALGVYWNIKGRLPTSGDILQGGTIALPFGTTVSSNLPNSIASLTLSASGNGIIITAIVQSDAFSTLTLANRQLVLGAKLADNTIIFQCGNFTANAAAPAGLGFPDRSLLPSDCSYNGVSNWLNT